MDRPATAALPARACAAAGPDAGRQHRLLLRPAPDVAVGVRRGHVRACACRGVQCARQAGTRPLASAAGIWCRSGVAGCLLRELYARGQPEFGVDVVEVGLHGPW
jgi:hypothetical protein